MGLLATGLSLSAVVDILALIPGLKLPRRVLREPLPLTSRVSVGVRRNVSEIDKMPLLHLQNKTNIESLMRI